MPNIIEIHDIQDPALDVYMRLTEGQLRNRQNSEKGMFIAESVKVIEHALDAGCVPLSLLMERRQIDAQAAQLIERCGSIPVYTADRETLSALTGFALTRGVLCAMKRPLLPKAEEILRSARRIAVLEGVVDPTNVGAILRSAAALNMDGVLLTPNCCDPLHRRAVRVSMGTVFQIPWTRICEKNPDWPDGGLALLKNAGFETAALALSDEAISVDDPALMAAEKLALILGAEGDGLSPRTIARCDHSVVIPMSHGVDSLNVAAAGAVAFWQLARRRP